jgi:disease resistance protein RPM1
VDEAATEVAYDAEDCVDIYFFHVWCRSGDRFLAWCKRLLTTLSTRRRLASDIRDLRSIASAINEQHARYGVSLEPLRRSASTSDTMNL